MTKVKTDTTHLFRLESIRDYNSLLQLIKEFDLELKSVKLVSSMLQDKSKEVVDIIVKGEENYLKFAEYLLNKEKAESEKMLKKIKLEEFEIE